MASIPGHIRDEVVVVGCHRDGMCHLASTLHCLTSETAWVLGAADPTSGTVSLHEIIRSFGALLKRGWKPLRTSIYINPTTSIWD